MDLSVVRTLIERVPRLSSTSPASDSVQMVAVEDSPLERPVQYSTLEVAFPTGSLLLVSHAGLVSFLK